MTEMEDSGFTNSLASLDAIHRVDINRAMILQTASNYSIQPPDGTAVRSVTETHVGRGKIAEESAWLCGSIIMHNLLANWDKYCDRIPGE